MTEKDTQKQAIHYHRCSNGKKKDETSRHTRVCVCVSSLLSTREQMRQRSASTRLRKKIGAVHSSVVINSLYSLLTWGILNCLHIFFHRYWCLFIVKKNQYETNTNKYKCAVIIDAKNLWVPFFSSTQSLWSHSSAFWLKYKHSNLHLIYWRTSLTRPCMREWSTK